MKAFWLCLAILAITATAQAQQLTASWYSIESLKAEGTYKYSKGVMANGQMFSDNGFTCASWDYPLGTWLLVTNRKGGNNVIVRTTDRTARRFKGRRIDLSKGAMEALGGRKALKEGLLLVKVEKVNED